MIENSVGTMKSTNKMLCLVNLPNGTTFGIQCDPKAIGQKCLEEVSHLSVHMYCHFSIWTQSNVPIILALNASEEQA